VSAETAIPARWSRPGWFRRAGLAVVMVGALSVSVRGQVEAVTPLLGGMSIVLALTNDVAALLALNEVISTRRSEVRRWAWAVLMLAGGTAAGLNTWHAIAAGPLPAAWAVVVGMGPVLLAMLLSHLVALVLEQAPPAPAPAPGSSPRSEAVSSVPAAKAEMDRPARARELDAEARRRAGEESSRAGQVQANTLAGPGIQPALAVVPAAGVRPPEGLRGPASAPPAAGARGSAVDLRVAQLEAQLRAGVELTGVMAAEQLGCSERTGRRLLRQAQERSHPPAERGTG
jgi:hypothetical protein